MEKKYLTICISIIFLVSATVFLLLHFTSSEKKIFYKGIERSYVENVSNPQHFIDNPTRNNPYPVVATSIHSNSDKQPTLFLGHNNKAFGFVLEIKKGETISIADGKTKKTYKVKAIFTTDKYGKYDVGTKQRNIKEFTKEKKEKIILQTCYGTHQLRFVIAE